MTEQRGDAVHEAVLQLSPWTRHHAACARVTEAGLCSCGLQRVLDRLQQQIEQQQQQKIEQQQPGGVVATVPVMVGTLAQAIAFARLVEAFAQNDGKEFPIDLLACTATSMYMQLRVDVEINRTQPELTAWEDREW